MVVKIAADTAALSMAWQSPVSNPISRRLRERCGTRGVMQISTAIADKHGVEASALWDAQTNIRLGLKILSNLFAMQNTIGRRR